MTDTTTAKAVPRTATMADMRARKRPARTRVTVNLDPDLLDELEEAKTVLAGLSGDDGRSEAQARVDELEARAEDAQAVFILQALGGKAYRELINSHPPTAEQRDAAKESGAVPVWDSDTFPTALVAACLEEPKATAAEMATIFDEWSESEMVAIVLAAIEVNTRSGVAARR